MIKQLAHCCAVRVAVKIILIDFRFFNSGLDMSQSSVITQSQFLTAAANLLHKSFFESDRAKTKSLYRSIAAGEVIPLTRIKMEDGGLATFSLALDSSEFKGKLPFSAFRNSLNALLQNLVNALQKDKSAKSFDNDTSKVQLFGIFGITEFNGEALVLALSADLSSPGDGTILKLMYLDPSQFLDSKN